MIGRASAGSTGAGAPLGLTPPQPVFAEPTGRRWRTVKVCASALLVLLCGLLVRELAPIGAMVRAPLPGPSPESVAAQLSTTAPVIGAGPMVRLVKVHDGAAFDPFTGARLGTLGTADLAVTGQDSTVVQRYGYSSATHQIALTFDDGPDPVWTPRVLAVLAEHHVQATFFVTGKAAANHPDLVRQIVREGHALGDHSMTHVNLSAVPEWRTRLELSGTQHLLAALTGRAVAFVRPPYDGGAAGNVAEEAVAVGRAQRLGLPVASYDVDTHDWEYGGGVGDGAAVGALPAQIAPPPLAGANVTLLMHDAGGNRAHTVEYLDRVLIPAAQSAGYSFVTVPQANPSAVLPQGLASDTGSPLNTAMTSLAWAWLVFPNQLMDWLFVLALVSVAAGGGFFAMLALVRRRRRQPPPRWSPDGSRPPLAVAIVIAAYNEATVIEATLRSLTGSTYPVDEFIVVDDGSTDGTGDIVERLSRRLDPRIRLIRQPNGKKPAALNNAFRQTDAEVIITVDADTHVDPDMVANLVRHFEADAYGTLSAVAGVVRVGNGNENFLTRWQALEYLTQIGVERAAHDLLGAIAIVPGACAAWRREAVQAAGGFSHSTLAEDADLTLSLHRWGWRVTQDDEALADTEAPEDVDSLLKQRVRWTYGSLQALVKHQDMLLRPRYGWLGMWIIPWGLLSLLVPLLTIPFVAVLSALAFASQGPAMLGGFYLVFTGAQFLTAAVAVMLLRQPLSHLLMVPAYRLMYEPMRAYLLYRSGYLATRGVSVGWNKLTRTGTLGRALTAQPAAASGDAAPRDDAPAAVTSTTPTTGTPVLPAQRRPGRADTAVEPVSTKQGQP